MGVLVLASEEAGRQGVPGRLGAAIAKAHNVVGARGGPLPLQGVAGSDVGLWDLHTSLGLDCPDAHLHL